MIKIGNNKHSRLKLVWIDICGDSTTIGPDDFNKMKCCEIVTECFLYDVIIIDSREYVRTFASYQVKDDFGYGDRNIYPIEVFTDESQKKIRKAWKSQKK